LRLKATVKNSKRPQTKSARGMTLIEVLVTGILFSVVLSMVAKAMVVGHQAQSSLSHKVHIHRQASTALDLLVRDAEVARFFSNVSFITPLGPTLPFPATETQANNPNELRITRMEGGTTIYDPPAQIHVGYWRSATDSTLRRTLYMADGLTVIPGTDAGGKVVARDVKEFDAKMVGNLTTGLSVLTVRLKVGTMEERVTKSMSLEGVAP
jgi:type II secretory pathway pseudopilin PulG